MTPIDLFTRDGYYLHTQSTLQPETLKNAAAGLAQVRQGVYDTGTTPAGRAWNPGDDPLSLCKIEQPQLANHALRKALQSPELGRLAGAITGAEWVQAWWVQGLYKPGSAADSSCGNVGWHQDRSYWREWEEGSELLTAWLALSDVTAEAGPMVFVPGSHKWGLVEGGDFFAQDTSAVKDGIAVPAGETWNEVPVVLPPGGVSFHHNLLFHGSHLNRSPHPRLSLAIHLCTDKSAIKPESCFAKYLDQPEICPVIYRK